MSTEETKGAEAPVAMEEDPTVSAQATEEALAAAVAASAAATIEMPAAGGAAAAGATLASTNAAAADPNAPTDRDVILGEGSAGHKTNLLLQDMIRLHRILWKLHDKAPPKHARDVEEMAQHIIELIRNGKSFELAGLRDVPRQFMKSTGRFFGPQDAETKEWAILSEQDVKKTVCEIILEDFKVDDLGTLSETPYRDLRQWIHSKKQPSASDGAASSKAIIMPEGRDVILLPCHDAMSEKMYEQQAGNKAMFNLASQLVTSFANSPEKRVEAALNIMTGLDDAETIPLGDRDVTTTAKSRFLIRTQRDDQSVAWDVLDAASAAEITLLFAFEGALHASWTSRETIGIALSFRFRCSLTTFCFINTQCFWKRKFTFIPARRPAKRGCCSPSPRPTKILPLPMNRRSPWRANPPITTSCLVAAA